MLYVSPLPFFHNIPCEVNGLFLSANVNQEQILMLYEHVSQDNVWTQQKVIESLGNIE